MSALARAGARTLQPRLRAHQTGHLSPHLACAAPVGDGQLRCHTQRVAQLGLASAELPVLECGHVVIRVQLGTSGRVVVRAGAARTPASMMVAGVWGGTATAFRQEGGCLVADHPTISVMHFVSARPPPSSWSTAEAPQVIRTISRWRCQGLGSGDEGGKALGGFCDDQDGRSPRVALAAATRRPHADQLPRRLPAAGGLAHGADQVEASAHSPRPPAPLGALTRIMQSVPVCQLPTLVTLRAASTIFSALASDRPLTAWSFCGGQRRVMGGAAPQQ